MTPNVAVSRIYLIDGVETNITTEGDNAQAALRNLERAAEELGAAPGALPLTAPPKGKGGRPKKDAAAPPEPEAPQLPAGAADAFAPPQLPFPSGSATPVFPPATATITVTETATVKLTDAPPVNLDASHVGLVPSTPAAPAPTFAPPPAFNLPPPMPPLDPRVLLRGQVDGVHSDIIKLVQAKNPAWLDQIAQTLSAIVANNGGSVQTATEPQLREMLSQFAQYDAQVRSALGA